jgi:SAM-dependent methyltransferase
MNQPLIVGNPKRRGKGTPQSRWYPYYPGFSESFACSVLSSAGLQEGQWVLDPWNGSGTSTAAARSLGINACGYDLNPVMALVAKARSLSVSEFPSVGPLSADLHRKSRKGFDLSPDDPLQTWLFPESAAAIRSIEAAIQRLLIDDSNYMSLNQRGTQGVSDLAAFFYIALFRAVRRVFAPFLTSNPTWVKRPGSTKRRIRPKKKTIWELFAAETKRMVPRTVLRNYVRPGSQSIIGVASSEQLPLARASIDFVLASPPYCTRIDYAVATSPELAILGFHFDSDFDHLRRGLIGTSTVPEETPEVSDRFGEECRRFLSVIERHRSHASSTYYYKNHIQYFSSISKSLAEISRVLKPGARCVLVAQDSYYKESHNDLPNIIREMSEMQGLRQIEKFEFPLTRTLAGINPGSKDYRSSFGATECVLVLGKQNTSKSTTRRLHSSCHLASR